MNSGQCIGILNSAMRITQMSVERRQLEWVAARMANVYFMSEGVPVEKFMAALMDGVAELQPLPDMIPLTDEQQMYLA